MTRLLIALLLIALGGGFGYWLARVISPMPVSIAPAERKPLFYRHPMNPKVTSPTPTKDEMGMDYVPVYAEEPALAGHGDKGRILYYRHPMGAADTSPVPKKDEMGMDYLPVYEGEMHRPGQVALSPERIQKLGVRIESVGKRNLARSIRALGTVQPDERRVHVVTTKYEGWIDRLHVNVTGQSVHKGQPLAEIYSPDLVSAQQEYLIALQGQQALAQGSEQAQVTTRHLLDNALARLRYWDIGEGELRRLKQTRQPRDTLTLLAPAEGVVMEKSAVAGMRFMPGDLLFRIVDLTSVWLMADVYEQDMDWIREGQAVNVHLKAYPDREFDGRVTFIQPMLNSETRTVKVRIELPNRDGALKPGMYGSVALSTVANAVPCLAVPDSAVIDSGTRQVVLVQLGEGLFEPRPVHLGRQADGYYEVLEGLVEGESVVTRANFLIDAESNLKSALDGFGAERSEKPEGSAETAQHQHGGM